MLTKGENIMSITVNNPLINSQSYLNEIQPEQAKKTILGISLDDVKPIATEIIKNILVNLSTKLINELTGKPELKKPDVIKSKESMRDIAKEIEYVKINEEAFAALYASLLSLFAQLNEASGKLTGMHATIAEKLAKSSGDKMIQGAIAQKNQAIAMAATSMGMSSIGLYQSQKGITKQESALKQESLSKELNAVNSDLNATINNGTNLHKVKDTADNSDVFSTHINYNNTKREANELEVNLKKLSGQKKQNTGNAISGMGQNAGHMVSSGYSVESATENSGSQIDATAKDTMLESEVKNRDNQNAARNTLKQLLDLIYKTLEKNNESISHITQILRI